MGCHNFVLPSLADQPHSMPQYIHTQQLTGVSSRRKLRNLLVDMKFGTTAFLGVSIISSHKYVPFLLEYEIGYTK